MSRGPRPRSEGRPSAARRWIGTSGWSYQTWRGLVYPPGLKRTDWLSCYAGRLRSVEINSSFYHLPRPSVLAGWVDRTPADFRFAVKAWRVLSHYRRLADCAEPLAAFLDRIETLGPKRGPVLIQLPPRWPVDPPRLAAFLDLLRGRGRFAIEFRDPSWHCEAVYALLRGGNVAFCPFELAEQRAPRVVTADFVYVRLHGRTARYRGAYTPAALGDWSDWLADQLAAGRDVHVYFDNTDEADHAVRDAERLDRMLARRGAGSA